jgi:hypothetical protein
VHVVGKRRRDKSQRNNQPDKRRKKGAMRGSGAMRHKGEVGGVGENANGMELLWQIEVQMTKQRQIPLSLGYFHECIWTALWALNW